MSNFSYNAVITALLHTSVTNVNDKGGHWVGFVYIFDMQLWRRLWADFLPSVCEMSKQQQRLLVLTSFSTYDCRLQLHTL